MKAWSKDEKRKDKLDLIQISKKLNLAFVPI